jgi:hypothetical protein
MHIQNLIKDGDTFSVQNCFAHIRGFFKKGKFEFSLSKRTLDHLFDFRINVGGHSGDRSVMFIFGILGFTIFLTAYNLVPKRWEHYCATRDKNGNYNHDNCMGREFGISWNSERLHLSWWDSISSGGRDPKYGWKMWIWMPWNWENSGHQYMNTDMQWVNEPAWSERDKAKRLTNISPYKYKLNNGEVQERIATITVSRMQWHKRFFVRVLKLNIGPKFRKQYIDVNFNDEVGEKAGDYKGGCTGCSYEMKKGELPLATLRRMERERKFN